MEYLVRLYDSTMARSTANRHRSLIHLHAGNPPIHQNGKAPVPDEWVADRI